MKRLLTTIALATVTTLALASCGTSSNDQDSSSESATSNKADVTFAKDMVPHHQQAVVMAEMAASRASSPQVKALASKIEAAQGPEIKTMTGWLKKWGEDVPSSSMGGMDPGSGGMSSDQMAGMMSSEQLDNMAGMDGTAFDQMWLRGMVAHHEGAIEMSRTEQADGQYPAAVALAKKIEADQTAEITQMKKLLAS